MATSAQSQHQRTTNVKPANWDQQLDSLLTELNNSTPAAGRATAPAPAPSTTNSTIVTMPSPVSGGGGILPSCEDYHEREEFSSSDQRTKTIQERSRRSARSDDRNQVMTQQTFKSQSHSSHPVSGAADSVDFSDLSGPADSPPDLTKLMPSINEPIAPGQMRLTKVEYHSTSSKQRSVSPQPAVQPGPLAKPSPPPALLAMPSPSPALLAKPSPPAVMPKPARSHLSPSLAAPVPAPLETVTRTTTVEQEQTGNGSGGGGGGAAGPHGSNTTINYHIYNYGAEGQPGPPPGAETSVRSVERYHETSGAAPWAPSPTGETNVKRVERYHETPGAAPWVPSPTGETSVKRVERYHETSGAAPWASPPTGEMSVKRVERYHETSGAAPWAPPPTGETSVKRMERYETRQEAADSKARPPSPYDTPAGPGKRYHSVIREMQRSQHHTTDAAAPGRDAAAQPFPTAEDGVGLDDGSRALVPFKPQDGTYPDGPRRRDLGSGHEVTTRTAGVYYPPDEADSSTTFQTKESHKNGNTKTKFEAKGRYKAKGGSRQAEDKGGKTIPICLPCCGGAACAIL